MISKNSPTTTGAGITGGIVRAGSEQLILAIALFAFALFTTEWRLFAALEVAIYFALAGGSLIIHGLSRRCLPMRKLAVKWLPIGRWILLSFLLFFGLGLVVAENGNVAAGLTLITIGYLLLVAKSALSLFRNRAS